MLSRIEIPRREWSQQLGALSKRYEGWLVSLNVETPPNPLLPEFRQLPLVGITAEARKDGTISIAVAEATGDQVTHTIHAPTHVFLERTGSGESAAIEVDSADGARAVLQLRTGKGK